MFKILLKFFMKILDMFTSILLTPFITAITVLFPDVSNSIQSVLDFLTLAFGFVGFARDLLMIPVSAMVIFFDYLLIKYSIYLIRIGVKQGIKIYQTFKP